MEFLVFALAIGIGATLVLDLWGVFLKRIFGIASLDYALVGRWIGHMPSGQWVHENIGRAEPIGGECLLGWTAHYAIGVVFAAGLLFVCGADWARQPTLVPALIAGLLTVLAPFLIMQPGLGLGIAASKTPSPNIARLKSIASHLVFGAGLFMTAKLLAFTL